MSGHWPPEWDDSYAELPDEWDADDGHHAEYPDQETSAVTAFLASIPSPVLPSGLEARISAAIAAEAAARSEGTGWPAGAGSVGTRADVAGSAGTPVQSVGPPVTSDGADDAKITDRSSRLGGFSDGATESGSPAAAKRGRRRTATSARGGASRSGPTGSRPGGRRRRLRMPPTAVTTPLLVCLAIVGFVIVIARLGGSSSSSSPLSEPAAQGTSSVASGGHDAGAAAPSSETAPRTDFGTYQNGQFVFIESGTSYQGSTLASQVRNQLTIRNMSAATVPALTPAASGVTASGLGVGSSSSASAAASTPISTPPPTLAGCVSGLTGSVTPRLVDRASYDGRPAFIIAVPTRVWVVRLGCTAANPQVITSVSLTGLYGNLSALGSVER